MSPLDERPQIKERTAFNGRNATEFIADFLGDVEWHCTEFFGQRWTPEILELYQSMVDGCLKTAQAIDGVDVKREDVLPRQDAGRVVTNYRINTR